MFILTLWKWITFIKLYLVSENAATTRHSLLLYRVYLDINLLTSPNPVVMIVIGMYFVGNYIPF